MSDTVLRHPCGHLRLRAANFVGRLAKRCISHCNAPCATVTNSQLLAAPRLRVIHPASRSARGIAQRQSFLGNLTQAHSCQGGEIDKILEWAALDDVKLANLSESWVFGLLGSNEEERGWRAREGYTQKRLRTAVPCPSTPTDGCTQCLGIFKEFSQGFAL